MIDSRTFLPQLPEGFERMDNIRQEEGLSVHKPKTLEEVSKKMERTCVDPDYMPKNWQPLD